MIERTNENLKAFVNNHIEPGIHVTIIGFPVIPF